MNKEINAIPSKIPRIDSRKNLLPLFQEAELSSSTHDKEFNNSLYKKHSKVSRKKPLLDKDLLNAVHVAFKGDVNVKIPRGESEQLRIICKILNLQFNKSNRLRIYKAWEKLKNSNMFKKTSGESSSPKQTPKKISSLEIDDISILKSSSIDKASKDEYCVHKAIGNVDHYSKIEKPSL